VWPDEEISMLLTRRSGVGIAIQVLFKCVEIGAVYWCHVRPKFEKDGLALSLGLLDPSLLDGGLVSLEYGTQITMIGTQSARSALGLASDLSWLRHRNTLRFCEGLEGSTFTKDHKTSTRDGLVIWAWFHGE
jgi:hypothetical protein